VEYVIYTDLFVHHQYQCMLYVSTGFENANLCSHGIALRRTLPLNFCAKYHINSFVVLWTPPLAVTPHWILHSSAPSPLLPLPTKHTLLSLLVSCSWWLFECWLICSINQHSWWVFEVLLLCGYCLLRTVLISVSPITDRSTVVLGVSLRLRWTSSTTTHVLQYSSTPVHSSTVILLHCTVLCYLQYPWQWTAVFGVAWGYGRPVVLLLISPLLHYDTAALYSTAVMALYTSTSTAADVPVQLKTKICHCSCPVVAPSSRCRCASTVPWQQYAAASLYWLQAGWYYCSFLLLFCIQSHIVPPLFCFFF
jgi:hypothetical protein